MSMAFALVCAALHLPHAILDPAIDARAEAASEAREEDEEFEECNIDEHEEEGEGSDEDQAEEVNISRHAVSQWTSNVRRIG
jgi:hypothetical protein